MRILHLDCLAGISGDMCAAALLDLAGEESWPDLVAAVAGLGIPGVVPEIRRTVRDGFACVEFEPPAETGHPPHRSLADIEGLIARAGLPPEAVEDAIAMFRTMARAEARVHGVAVADVRFHEVGAADSIVDVVAIAWARRRLAVEGVTCSPLPLGRGWVDCAHGRIPLPAPAVLAILECVPVEGTDLDGETVTPTGAAAAVVLAGSFGPLPPCRIAGVGIGAGRARRRAPNLLRAVLAEAGHGIPSRSPADVVEIETTIDDMSPEAYAPLVERLLAEGALDVHLAAVQMKKGRPGTVVSVLAEPGDRDRLAKLVLENTTTFGVRFSPRERLCLDREQVRVDTQFGPVMAKAGRLDGRLLRIVPEYEDVRRIAAEKGVSFLEVYEAAQSSARKAMGSIRG